MMTREELEAEQNLKKAAKKLYDKARYEANAEQVKLRAKAYRESNLERIAQYKAEYRERNKSKLSASGKIHYEQNQEKYKARARQGRAKRHGVVAEFFTAAQVIELHGSNCHLCSLPIDLEAPRWRGLTGYKQGLHLDHVIPLIDGGTHTLENVRPAHASCNLKKNRFSDKRAEASNA